MVQGWQFERFLRYMAFFELEEGEVNHRGTLSMSMDASYHKEQQCIWFMGADLNGFSDI